MTTPFWILGAGGMLAGEFLRLAASHPELSLAGAITRARSTPLRALHPHLATDASTTTLEEALPALGDAPAGAWLVLALPHAEAAATWRKVRERIGAGAERLRVLDLSADYRLADTSEYERWYGSAHADEGELTRFRYALPELTDSLSGATRLAAPGCFATALQLACIPPAAAGALSTEAPWVVHAVTGSSGSGAKPKAGTHHPHRNSNLVAYGRGGHRHEAELSQALAPFELEPQVTFLPHSGPFVRGIHLSATLPLARELDERQARAIFAARFEGAPFVEICADSTPDLRSVVGSNRASVGCEVRGSVLIVAVTLDNLVKGGSGQALQAINLASDWPETIGLPLCGLGAN